MGAWRFGDSAGNLVKETHIANEFVNKDQPSGSIVAGPLAVIVACRKGGKLTQK